MVASATFWQRGETIECTNSGDTTIAANTIQVIGQRIGVVAGEALPGATYSVNVVGIYAMPKDTAAITQGALVYYTESAGTVSATQTDGSVLAGYAVEAAAASDTTVKVKINA